MSVRWNEDQQFLTSHHGELQAPLHFLRRGLISDVVLIWITDCLSAAWSINKGRCHAEISMAALEEILQLCDEQRVQLMALWVPREENAFADYLSHLSVYVGRQQVSGRL